MEYEIELDELERRDTAVFRGHASIDGLGDFLGLAFRQVMGALRGQPVDGPPFARYVMVGDGFDVEAGFPVPDPISTAGQVEASLLPGGTVATTVHVGSYAELGGAYSALETWFSANGFEAAGDPWESYLDGPEVDAPRTIISWPCREV